MKSYYGIFVVLSVVSILKTSASALRLYDHNPNQASSYYPNQWSAPEPEYTSSIQTNYNRQRPKQESSDYNQPGYQPKLYGTGAASSVYRPPTLYPMESTVQRENAYKSPSSTSLVGDSYSSSQNPPLVLETNNFPFKPVRVPLSNSEEPNTFKSIRHQDAIDATREVLHVISELDRIRSKLGYSDNEGTPRASEQSTSYNGAQAISKPTLSSGNGQVYDIDPNYPANYYRRDNQGAVKPQGTIYSDTQASSSVSTVNQGRIDGKLHSEYIRNQGGVQNGASKSNTEGEKTAFDYYGDQNGVDNISKLYLQNHGNQGVEPNQPENDSGTVQAPNRALTKSGKKARGYNADALLFTHPQNIVKQGVTSTQPKIFFSAAEASSSSTNRNQGRVYNDGKPYSQNYENQGGNTTYNEVEAPAVTNRTIGNSGVADSSRNDEIQSETPTYEAVIQEINRFGNTQAEPWSESGNPHIAYNGGTSNPQNNTKQEKAPSQQRINNAEAAGNFENKDVSYNGHVSYSKRKFFPSHGPQHRVHNNGNHNPENVNNNDWQDNSHDKYFKRFPLRRHLHPLKYSSINSEAADSTNNRSTVNEGGINNDGNYETEGETPNQESSATSQDGGSALPDLGQQDTGHHLGKSYRRNDAKQERAPTQHGINDAEATGIPISSSENKDIVYNGHESNYENKYPPSYAPKRRANNNGNRNPQNVNNKDRQDYSLHKYFKRFPLRRHNYPLEHSPNNSDAADSTTRSTVNENGINNGDKYETEDVAPSQNSYATSQDGDSALPDLGEPDTGHNLGKSYPQKNSRQLKATSQQEINDAEVTDSPISSSANKDIVYNDHESNYENEYSPNYVPRRGVHNNSNRNPENVNNNDRQDNSHDKYFKRFPLRRHHHPLKYSPINSEAADSTNNRSTVNEGGINDGGNYETEGETPNQESSATSQDGGSALPDLGQQDTGYHLGKSYRRNDAKQERAPTQHGINDAEATGIPISSSENKDIVYNGHESNYENKYPPSYAPKRRANNNGNRNPQNVNNKDRQDYSLHKYFKRFPLRRHNYPLEHSPNNSDAADSTTRSTVNEVGINNGDKYETEDVAPSQNSYATSQDGDSALPDLGEPDTGHNLGKSYPQKNSRQLKATSQQEINDAEVTDSPISSSANKDIIYNDHESNYENKYSPNYVPRRGVHNNGNRNPENVNNNDRQDNSHDKYFKRFPLRRHHHPLKYSPNNSETADSTKNRSTVNEGGINNSGNYEKEDEAFSQDSNATSQDGNSTLPDLKKQDKGHHLRESYRRSDAKQEKAPTQQGINDAEATGSPSSSENKNIVYKGHVSNDENKYSPNYVPRRGVHNNGNRNPENVNNNDRQDNSHDKYFKRFPLRRHHHPLKYSPINSETADSTNNRSTVNEGGINDGGNYETEGETPNQESSATSQDGGSALPDLGQQDTGHHLGKSYRRSDAKQERAPTQQGINDAEATGSPISSSENKDIVYNGHESNYENKYPPSYAPKRRANNNGNRNPENVNNKDRQDYSLHKYFKRFPLRRHNYPLEHSPNNSDADDSTTRSTVNEVGINNGDKYETEDVAPSQNNYATSQDGDSALPDLRESDTGHNLGKSYPRKNSRQEVVTTQQETSGSPSNTQHIHGEPSKFQPRIDNTQYLPADSDSPSTDDQDKILNYPVATLQRSMDGRPSNSDKSVKNSQDPQETEYSPAYYNTNYPKNDEFSNVKHVKGTLSKPSQDNTGNIAHNSKKNADGLAPDDDFYYPDNIKPEKTDELNNSTPTDYIRVPKKYPNDSYLSKDNMYYDNLDDNSKYDKEAVHDPHLNKHIYPAQTPTSTSPDNVPKQVPKNSQEEPCDDDDETESEDDKEYSNIHHRTSQLLSPWLSKKTKQKSTGMNRAATSGHNNGESDNILTPPSDANQGNDNTDNVEYATDQESSDNGTKTTADKTTAVKGNNAKSSGAKSVKTSFKNTAARSTAAKTNAAKTTAVKITAARTTATKTTAVKSTGAKSNSTKNTGYIDSSSLPQSNSSTSSASTYKPEDYDEYSNYTGPLGVLFKILGAIEKLLGGCEE